MPRDTDHEEIKVQEALALLKQHPTMTAADAARQTRASYHRLIRRRRGIPPSNTRGGRNKKLAEPQTEALRNHLLMCHSIGRPANIDNVVASANSILRCEGLVDTVSRRWAKRWINRQRDFLKTLRSKPLSTQRRSAHIREDIETHFEEFAHCKNHWSIQDDDCYNFDETGCQIEVTSGGLVVVPVGADKVYIDDPDNKELVTSTECIGASGYHVPPMLIFKGASIFESTLRIILMVILFLHAPKQASPMISLL